MEIAIATVLLTGLMFKVALHLMNKDRQELHWSQVETEWKECPACKGEGGTGKYNLCCLYCMGAGGALVRARSKK